MANWNQSEDDQQYKCLAIENKSKAQITLYIYSGWAPFCKFSTFSKIIKSDEEYRYYEETSFKFEIVAKALDEPLLGPQECNEDKLITITESLVCEEKNLAIIKNGRRILLRKIHRDQELESVAGRSNLYDVLGLDMEEVRKMENEDAKEAIENAYKKQMLIWHPDRNFGDHEIATQINKAKKILMDDAKRAHYHNEVDYNKGRLSPKRWKAVFRPDCYTEEQKKAYKCIVNSRASAATSTLEGDAVEQVSAMTGGRRVAYAVAGAVSRQVTLSGTKARLGTAFTVAKERLDDSVENQKITNHVQSGIENITVEVVQNAALYTAGGFIGHGIEEATLDEQSYSRNAATNNESKAESYPNSNEGHENNQGQGNGTNEGQGASEENSEPRNVTNKDQGDNEPEEKMASKLSFFATTSKAESCLNSNEAQPGSELSFFAATSEAESCPNSNEAQPVSKLSFFAATSEAKSCPSSNEAQPVSELSFFAATSESESCLNSNEAQSVSKLSFFQRNVSHTIEMKTTDDQCHEGHCRSTQQNPHAVNVESIANISSNGKSYRENREPSDERNKKQKADEPPKAMIKYRSEGAWRSKMIVTFDSNGKKHEKEASGDGKRVYIPADATNVQVKFQVWRPGWGDLKTFDRFKKRWSDTPHIFRYEKATDRTFTISGPLWWEGVIRVSDEYHEETKEMC